MTLKSIQYSVKKYLIVFFLFISNGLMAEDIIRISNFSKEPLSNWNEEIFEGKTTYQLVKLNGKSVLRADSNKSASGLYKEVRINLNKTPFLNWSWQIDTPLNDINEKSKSGDDYAARLYVIQKHSFLFWKTKALNYVWSSNQTKLSQWDNAYTSQAKMLAIRGKLSPTQQWFSEKRNVKEDLKKAFNEDVEYIDVVAIMSDTDNAKLSTTAFYGDIFFSSE